MGLAPLYAPHQPAIFSLRRKKNKSQKQGKAFDGPRPAGHADRRCPFFRMPVLGEAWLVGRAPSRRARQVTRNWLYTIDSRWQPIKAACSDGAKRSLAHPLRDGETKRATFACWRPAKEGHIRPDTRAYTYRQAKKDESQHLGRGRKKGEKHTKVDPYGPACIYSPECLLPFCVRVRLALAANRACISDANKRTKHHYTLLQRSSLAGSLGVGQEQTRRARLWAAGDRRTAARRHCRMAMRTRCAIDDLPDEVMAIILGYGDCTALYGSAPAVSTRWRALAADAWARTQPVCTRRPHNDIDRVGPYIASITGEDTLPWRSYAHAEGCPMRALASVRAARDGRIRVLYVLCRMLGHPWVPGVCVHAAARGQLDVLTYASAHGHPYDEAACEAAAISAGQYAVIDWLWKSRPPSRADVDRAAEKGDVCLLRLLQARRCPRGKSTVAAAARGGHVDAVVWLLRHRCPWGASAIAAAAGAARVDVLKLLLARWEDALSPDVMDTAVASHGDAVCIDLLWSRIVADRASPHRRYDKRNNKGDDLDDADIVSFPGQPAHADASRWLALAAGRGDPSLVDHLLRRGCRPTPAAFAAAAAKGHIDVLVSLDRVERAWDVSATVAAASHGRLAVLRHLHKQDCPWDETTCAAAAGAGHIDCLAYARTHGCPWDARVYVEAVRYGHVHVLAYARKSRCPCDDTVCREAAVCSVRSPETAQYVRRELCRHRAKDCYLWTVGTTRHGTTPPPLTRSEGIRRRMLGRMVPRPSPSQSLSPATGSIHARARVSFSFFFF
nr:ankyrin repeat protein [Pandoravirus massiliensis]